MQPTCFISHSSEDRGFVEEKLLGLLQALSVTPWYSKWHIATASDWEQAIGIALHNSNWFLVVVSTKSVRAPWVKREVDWAMEHLPGRVIPILTESIPLNELHASLERVQYVDFRNESSDGVNQLVNYFVSSEYLPNRRQSAFQGEWIGFAIQDHSINGPKIRIEVRLSLRLNVNHLSGTFEIVVPTPTDSEAMTFNADCETFYERFIQVNYRSTEKEMVQFGAILLEIDDAGRVMKGRYTGYGAISRTLVSGIADMHKVQSRIISNGELSPK